MRILKVVGWSAACVALGVFLASYSIDGRTPVQHAERALSGKVKPPSLEQVKGDVTEAIDAAKKKLGEVRPSPDKPTERHTVEDKEAVNKLIARRKP